MKKERKPSGVPRGFAFRGHSVDKPGFLKHRGRDYDGHLYLLLLDSALA